MRQFLVFLPKCKKQVFFFFSMKIKKVRERGKKSEKLVFGKIIGKIRRKRKKNYQHLPIWRGYGFSQVWPIK